MRTHKNRQPVFYITHGGGPCFWMDTSNFFGKDAFDGLRTYFEGLLKNLAEHPKAILMITAHWEENIPTLSTAVNPPMLYDYYGFPEHTYHLQYPAPGAPDLAARAQELLNHAGIETHTNDSRGFDHGVFVPMMIIDSKAEIPLAMMSIRADFDPAAHLAIGEALQPLRDEGVLIIASGSSYHNLRALFAHANLDTDIASIEFDRWLVNTVANEPGERKKHLIAWEKAPYARACHPREEHLIPLMVAAGAAGDQVGRQTFFNMIGGKAFSCFGFGL